MNFHKDRLKVCNRAVRNITFTAHTEPDSAYDVRDLMVMASQGKPLPSLKSYNFMDSQSIDLSVPTDSVDDICSAVALASRAKEYEESKSLWEKEKSDEALAKAKEAEKQKIISEYESSKQNVPNV